jgi:predicted alpha/beta-fold hydrolase
MFYANMNVFRKHLPDLDPDALLRHRWVEDFDRDLTIKLMGFDSTEAFYRAQACDFVVKGVQVPLLVVHAQDDPVVPMRALPLQDIKDNKHIMFVLTRTGGHTGWLHGSHPERVRGRSWFDHVALEWTNSHVAYHTRLLQKNLAMLDLDDADQGGDAKRSPAANRRANALSFEHDR